MPNYHNDIDFLAHHRQFDPEKLRNAIPVPVNDPRQAELISESYGRQVKPKYGDGYHPHAIPAAARAVGRVHGFRQVELSIKRSGARILAIAPGFNEIKILLSMKGVKELVVLWPPPQADNSHHNIERWSGLLRSLGDHFVGVDTSSLDVACSNREKTKIMTTDGVPLTFVFDSVQTMKVDATIDIVWSSFTSDGWLVGELASKVPQAVIYDLCFKPELLSLWCLSFQHGETFSAPSEYVFDHAGVKVILYKKKGVCSKFSSADVKVVFTLCEEDGSGEGQSYVTDLAHLEERLLAGVSGSYSQKCEPIGKGTQVCLRIISPCKSVIEQPPCPSGVMMVPDLKSPTPKFIYVFEPLYRHLCKTLTNCGDKNLVELTELAFSTLNMRLSLASLVAEAGHSQVFSEYEKGVLAREMAVLTQLFQRDARAASRHFQLKDSFLGQYYFRARSGLKVASRNLWQSTDVHDKRLKNQSEAFHEISCTGRPIYYTPQATARAMPGFETSPPHATLAGALGEMNIQVTGGEVTDEDIPFLSLQLPTNERFALVPYMNPEGYKFLVVKSAYGYTAMYQKTNREALMGMIEKALRKPKVVDLGRPVFICVPEDSVRGGICKELGDTFIDAAAGFGDLRREGKVAIHARLGKLRSLINDLSRRTVALVKYPVNATDLGSKPVKRIEVRKNPFASSTVENELVADEKAAIAAAWATLNIRGTPSEAFCARSAIKKWTLPALRETVIGREAFTLPRNVVFVDGLDESLVPAQLLECAEALSLRQGVSIHKHSKDNPLPRAIVDSGFSLVVNDGTVLRQLNYAFNEQWSELDGEVDEMARKNRLSVYRPEEEPEIARAYWGQSLLQARGVDALPVKTKSCFALYCFLPGVSAVATRLKEALEKQGHEVILRNDDGVYQRGNVCGYLAAAVAERAVKGGLDLSTSCEELLTSKKLAEYNSKLDTQPDNMSREDSYALDRRESLSEEEVVFLLDAFVPYQEAVSVCPSVEVFGPDGVNHLVCDVTVFYDAHHYVTLVDLGQEVVPTFGDDESVAPSDSASCVPKSENWASLPSDLTTISLRGGGEVVVKRTPRVVAAFRQIQSQALDGLRDWKRKHADAPREKLQTSFHATILHRLGAAVDYDGVPQITKFAELKREQVSVVAELVEGVAGSGKTHLCGAKNCKEVIGITEANKTKEVMKAHLGCENKMKGKKGKGKGSNKAAFTHQEIFVAGPSAEQRQMNLWFDECHLLGFARIAVYLLLFAEDGATAYMTGDPYQLLAQAEFRDDESPLKGGRRVLKDTSHTMCSCYAERLGQIANVPALKGDGEHGTRVEIVAHSAERQKHYADRGFVVISNLTRDSRLAAGSVQGERFDKIYLIHRSCKSQDAEEVRRHLYVLYSRLRNGPKSSLIIATPGGRPPASYPCCTKLKVGGGVHPAEVAKQIGDVTVATCSITPAGGKGHSVTHRVKEIGETVAENIGNSKSKAEHRELLFADTQVAIPLYHSEGANSLPAGNPYAPRSILFDHQLGREMLFGVCAASDIKPVAIYGDGFQTIEHMPYDGVIKQLVDEAKKKGKLGTFYWNPAYLDKARPKGDVRHGLEMEVTFAINQRSGDFHQEFYTGLKRAVADNYQARVKQNLVPTRHLYTSGQFESMAGVLLDEIEASRPKAIKLDYDAALATVYGLNAMKTAAKGNFEEERDATLSSQDTFDKMLLRAQLDDAELPSDSYEGLIDEMMWRRTATMVAKTQVKIKCPTKPKEGQPVMSVDQANTYLRPLTRACCRLIPMATAAFMQPVGPRDDCPTVYQSAAPGATVSSVIETLTGRLSRNAAKLMEWDVVAKDSQWCEVFIYLLVGLLERSIEGIPEEVLRLVKEELFAMLARSHVKGRNTGIKYDLFWKLLSGLWITLDGNTATTILDVVARYCFDFSAAPPQDEDEWEQRGLIYFRRLNPVSSFLAMAAAGDDITAVMTSEFDATKQWEGADLFTQLKPNEVPLHGVAEFCHQAFAVSGPLRGKHVYDVLRLLAKIYAKTYTAEEFRVGDSGSTLSGYVRSIKAKLEGVDTPEGLATTIALLKGRYPLRADFIELVCKQAIGFSRLSLGDYKRLLTKGALYRPGMEQHPEPVA